MSGDNTVMKNKAADLTNLPVKPCLKPGPPLPRFQPTIFSIRLLKLIHLIRKCGWYNWSLQNILGEKIVFICT
jgi:hypothetical protein